MHIDMQNAVRGVVAAGLIALATPAALAQGSPAGTSAGDVRAEVSEAMDAIARYSVQERDRALARARDALNRLDAEIERREQALREAWPQMSERARATAQARLRDLRAARNTLGERYGALQAGASAGWDELRAGFSNAWTAFSDAWRAADQPAPAD